MPAPTLVHHRAPSAACAAGAALAGVARAFAAALREYRERRAVRHLLELDDHLLRDLGLARDEVERAVRRGWP